MSLRKSRATQDLQYRQTYFVRKRAELLAHIQNTSWQYRLESFGRRLAHRSVEGFRDEVLGAFDDPEEHSTSKRHTANVPTQLIYGTRTHNGLPLKCEKVRGTYL